MTEWNFIVFKASSFYGEGGSAELGATDFENFGKGKDPTTDFPDIGAIMRNKIQLLKYSDRSDY